MFLQPQSQINKCNNEKRRREMENNYIEQLSEFLQLNKRGDMTSTKPDKAAILNQVVRTVSQTQEDGFNSQGYYAKLITATTTTTSTINQKTHQTKLISKMLNKLSWSKRREPWASDRNN